MKRFAPVLAWILMVLPAVALTPADQVRALLDGGEIDALETLVMALHKASIRDHDPSDLRAIYQDVIATTHPGRNEAVRLWRKQYPSSPYAAAAEAWMEMTHADLYGGRRAATKLRVAALERAEISATEAVRNAGDFAPALEGWLFLSKESREPFGLLPISEALLKIGPQRETMLQIIRAIDGAWSDSVRDVVGLCHLYADLVPGYNSDFCLIDAAVRLSRISDLRRPALEFLAAIDDPMIEDSRALAVLNHRFEMDNAADRLVVWHRGALRTSSDAANHYSQGAIIAFRFDRPDYAAEAQAAALRFIDTRLLDDPRNPSLLREKIRILFFSYQSEPDPLKLAEARRAWPVTLHFGQFDPDTWQLGALLEGADRHVSDVATRSFYWENAIAQHEGFMYPVLMHFGEMHAAYENALQRQNTEGAPEEPGALAPEAVLETVRCPLLRAARVMHGFCRLEKNQGSMCNPEDQRYRPVLDIIKEGRTGLCDEVAQTPLSELSYRYSPLPGETGAAAKEGH